jgi:hypothetical protein
MSAAESDSFVKTTTLAILIATIALTLFLIAPSLSWVGSDAIAIHKDKSTPHRGADSL